MSPICLKKSQPVIKPEDMLTNHIIHNTDHDTFGCVVADILTYFCDDIDKSTFCFSWLSVSKMCIRIVFIQSWNRLGF